jgi:hypothetical protein
VATRVGAVDRVPQVGDVAVRHHSQHGGRPGLVECAQLAIRPSHRPVRRGEHRQCQGHADRNQHPRTGRPPNDLPNGQERGDARRVAGPPHDQPPGDRQQPKHHDRHGDREQRGRQRRERVGVVGIEDAARD